jgi:hypothetical protein
LIERNSGEVRAVNDIFFGALTPSQFAAATTAMTALVLGSARAVSHVDRAEIGSWKAAAE